MKHKDPIVTYKKRPPRGIPLIITTEVFLGTHSGSIEVRVSGEMTSIELGTLIHVLTEFSTTEDKDVISHVYKKPSGAAVAACRVAISPHTKRAYELRDTIATRLAEALSR